MSKYWNNTVKNIEPYVPGEQPRDRKYIKINTNEAPYPPSPRAVEAVKAAAGDILNLYPDPNCTELRETIADYYNLKSNEVFIGNGSDEVLAFAFMTFFSPGEPILFADITYSFYPVYSDLFGLQYELVPLRDDLTMDVGGFLKRNGGIVIANPNAPTGIYLGIESIEKIIQSNPESVVVVDEAYIDFGGQSAAPLIKKYPNLLAVHTLSKSRSLAGLRIGYALGHEDLIEGLNRVKNSFNSYTVDRLALIGATESFRDEEYFRETRSKIISTRERVSRELNRLGFKATDSKTNFVFISHPDVPAKELFLMLRQKGILVRYFNKPVIHNHLRVSIGSDYEMDCFLEAVKDILS